VNGIRACAKKGLFEFLASANPDVICLQETKAHPEQLPKEFLNAADPAGKPYHIFFSSAKRRGYSGTAIYSRVEPRSFSKLGVEEFDDEGRVSVADFGETLVISAYFPNSQDGGKRLDYKLRFCASMLEYCRARVAEGRHVILCGDYNIAHKPIDLANPEQNEKNPGYLPAEREWMDAFTAAGFVDSFRAFCQEPKQYTWWTYRVPGARERNIGWRLDYHCVDAPFMPRVKDARILPEVMGSDHCPVSLSIKGELN
jgi:exodeoxyribonuclease-3